MTLQPIIEKLATTINLCSPKDKGELDALIVLFGELTDGLGDSPPAGMLELCEVATLCLQAIVVGLCEDPDLDFAYVQKLISYALDLVEAIDEGKSTDAFKLPAKGSGEESDSEAPCVVDVDAELLEMFLSSCNESIQTIEECLLNLAGETEGSEVIRDLRMVVHTLKGECGVIPLPVAQKILHEAESQIDNCLAKDRPVPVDALLGVVDWCKEYIILLAENPSCPAPAADEILELLKHCADSTENDSEPPAPTAAADQAPTPADETASNDADASGEKAAALARVWGLGADIERAIRYHHSPSSLEDDTLVDITYAADLAANHLGYGVGYDGHSYTFDEDALARLKLDRNEFSNVLVEASVLLREFEDANTEPGSEN